MKNSYEKGITFLEILIVCAIVGILAAIVLPQFAKVRENQVVKDAVGNVLSALDLARSYTLASVDSSEYGVHFASDSVIIFKGDVFSAIAPENQVTAITSPASISSITLVGGGSDIYFNRLSGAPSTSGSLVVSSTNFTKTITISTTGIASVN